MKGLRFRPLTSYKYPNYWDLLYNTDYVDLKSYSNIKTIRSLLFPSSNSALPYFYKDMDPQNKDPATLLAPIPELSENIPATIPPDSRWNYIRNWWIRSESTSEIAERRLLTRARFFSIDTNKNKNNHFRTKIDARVGLVDIGGVNRKVNTLVIEEVENTGVQGDENSTKVNGTEDVRSTEFAGMGYSDKSQADIIVRSNSITTNSPPKDKKVLVMAHGYGAGLGFFYRNYNALAQVPGWRVYSIDWLGMGRSSRPKWHIKTGSIDEAESFFVESLEDWRKVHGIEKFTLMGHSLGGYMSACYALKYPNRVERLILVSPVGIPNNPDEIPPPSGQPEKPRRNIPGWAKHLWNMNITPFAIVRNIGPFGPYLVNAYASRRFAHLDPDDQRDLYDYLYNISTASGSSEYALASILAPGAYARRPLITRLHGLKMPTTFLYGEQDWMDYKAAAEACKTMSVPTKIVRIPDAGHHLYLDNPPEFDRALISEMKEVQKEHPVKS